MQKCTEHFVRTFWVCQLINKLQTIQVNSCQYNNQVRNVDDKETED